MNKIKIKNKEYSRTKVRNNILRVWNKTNEEDRYDWYMEANDFCTEASQIYHVSNSKIIGTLSALSPLKTWEQNKQMLHDFFTYGTAGTFAVNVDKCHRILESDGTDRSILRILNGEKTKNFYLNIKYPLSAEHLTVDRHAIRIALNCTEEFSISVNQYQFIKNCYIEAAKKVNVKPLLMQSATWVYFRDNN